MSENCVFCKIAQKQASASIVYEDAEVLAFMDIKPVNEGHTLVIPKAHFADIFDIPEDLNASVHRITKRIAVAVQKVTQADGISVVQQNGQAAGQEVFHLHVHVIPRNQGDHTRLFGKLSQADRGNLDELAAKIKRQL
jgi:histidine triad (HIT) family protein